MKRNKNLGSRQSLYYGVGEEGKCVGIQNKNSRSAPWSLMFLLLDCHILYHLKQELVLFYIAEKDSSGSTLIPTTPLPQDLCECKDVRVVHLISAVPKGKKSYKVFKTYRSAAVLDKGNYILLLRLNPTSINSCPCQQL